MMILNNGVRMVKPDNSKLQMDAPEVLATIEWELSLVKQGLMRAHDGTASGGYKERLPDGTVLFQFGVPARVVTYRSSNIPLGVGFYPLGPSNKEKANYSHGASYGMGVFKNGAKQSSAAALASLATTQMDAGLIYAMEAGTPPSYKYAVASASLQDYLKNNPDTGVFYQGLSSFLPYPPVPAFEDVRAEIDKHLLDIWAGKVSARDGLAEAQRIAQLIADAAAKGA
jgi:ABC-type glycerol-3-phosphate transport system substrate-binding protein